MVGCLLTATMGTFVSGASAPSFEICPCGECVEATVDDEFHGAFGKIVDVRLPCHIIFFCSGDLQIFTLDN